MDIDLWAFLNQYLHHRYNKVVSVYDRQSRIYVNDLNWRIKERQKVINMIETIAGAFFLFENQRLAKPARNKKW